MRGTGGCPDLGVLKQILIEESLQRLRMADGRDAADDKAGLLPDEISIGLGYGLADQSGELAFVDAVRAAGNDQDGSAAVRAAEHEGLGDLPDAAPDRLSGLSRRPGGPGELDDLQLDPQALQSLLDAPSARTQIGRHPASPRQARSAAWTERVISRLNSALNLRSY